MKHGMSAMSIPQSSAQGKMMEASDRSLVLEVFLKSSGLMSPTGFYIK